MSIGKSVTLVFVLWLLFFIAFAVYREQAVLLAQKRQQTLSVIEGVPFIYEQNDFGKVEAKRHAKINSEDESVRDKFPIDMPARTCFDLEAKRPLPALEKGARYFFPAHSFICFIPTSDATEKDFAAAYPNFSQSVAKLRKLLEKRPADFSQFDDLFDVPYNNAGWSFKSKVQYLDYRNVAGVFFLTQYSQEMTPNLVNNEELTANFQGLTKDGNFYVAARFAVTHPTLPGGIDFTDSKIQEDALKGKTNDEINQAVGKYLRKEREKVEKLPEETFRPSITNLKKLLASITLNK
jgi:hypothetical protein